MNNLSDNPYHALCSVDYKHFNLNSYIFKHSAEPREVSIEKLYFFVREMLAFLGFEITLLGYRYLAKLMQFYLVCEDGYDLDKGLTYVSERYGVECSFVKANISRAIELNGKLRTVASKALSMSLSEKECGEVDSVVLILGAIFKRYYNCNVIGDKETEEDKILLIHKHRMLFNE